MYDVLVSTDAVDYQTVYSTSSGKGGKVTVPFTASGRYVRLLCKSRNTTYGASVWEMEVYGSGRCEPDPTKNPITMSPQNTYKFLKNGQIFISRCGVVYTLDGRVCLHTQD